MGGDSIRKKIMDEFDGDLELLPQELKDEVAEMKSIEDVVMVEQNLREISIAETKVCLESVVEQPVRSMLWFFLV